MIRVLFICLGNICRSPMAEAVFRDMVQKEHLSGKIEADSAGTGEWHIGEMPHVGTRKILDEQKISYQGLKARQIHKKDWDDFDYIIAMDDQNIKDLRMLNMKEKGVITGKLMDYLDDEEENVPDPYYTGNFDYTYDLVRKGCQKLLDSIMETHNLAQGEIRNG